MTSSEADAPDKKIQTKQLTKREALIKKFIHRICTPVQSEQRISAIDAFFNSCDKIEFDDKEAQFIWKGLFYSIWYTEMGKGCEQVMSSIVRGASKQRNILLTGFSTLSTEWGGIDYIRLDKFAHFARLLLQSLLQFVFERDEARVDLVKQTLDKIKRAKGLYYHLLDIYTCELLKCINNSALQHQKEKSRMLQKFTTIFLKDMVESDDSRTLNIIRLSVFRDLPERLQEEEDLYTLNRYLVQMTRLFSKLAKCNSLNSKRRAFFKNISNNFKGNKPSDEQLSSVPQKRRRAPSSMSKKRVKSQ